MDQMIVILLILFLAATIASFVYRKFVLGPSKPKKKVLSITAGFSAMRGRRETMEDEHVVLTNLRSNTEFKAFSHFPPASKSSSSSPLAFFGVYDGHRGSRCAKFVAQNLHKNIFNSQAFIQGVQSSSSSLIIEGIKQGYSETDTSFLTEATKKQNKFLDGSTSVTALFINSSLYISNLGDSEALLVSHPNTFQVLSFKHKPSEESEKKRIQAAGGIVFGGRVGGLSVSRSFGDSDVKIPSEEDGYKVGVLMSAEPYIKEEIDEISKEKGHHYLLIGCDGVWEAMNYQATVDFVSERLKEKEQGGKEITEGVLSEILAELGKEAMRKGCGDNISSILVYFS